MKIVCIWTSGSGGDVAKNVSYLELVWLSCSFELHHFNNFGRGHYE